MISKRTVGLDYPELYDAIMEVIHNGEVYAMNSSWWISEGDIVIVHKAFAAAYVIGDAMVAIRGNNNNSDPVYPASFGPWMISVGAHKNIEEKASYSSYSGGMDFLAPGGNADANEQNDIYTTTRNNAYCWAHGTSMAAPFVTGIISLLHDYYGFVFSDDFEEILKKSCINMYEQGYDYLSGWGRVNADSAFKFITFPNEVFYWIHSNAEPYTYQSSEQFTMRCYGWSGLFDGDYLVVRHEIRADVVYEDDFEVNRFNNGPYAVWGCAQWTNGLAYNDGSNPHYEIRLCEKVLGTWSESGITLRTYVYDVWDMDGDYIGLFPIPAGSNFYYTVVGDAPPQVPTGLSISPDQDHHPIIQWNHNPESDVDGYKVFRWIYELDDDFVQIGDVPGGTNYYIDYEYIIPYPGHVSYWTSLGDYTVLAYDEVDNESDMADPVTTWLNIPGYPAKPMEKIGNSGSKNFTVPDKYELLNPYPNPFNSQTKIKFNLPEISFTRIEIYNTNGQLVKKIVYEIFPADSYEVIWDATDSKGNIVSGGIYLIVMTTDTYKESKKVVLIK